MTWTDDQVATLRRLWPTGKTLEAVAKSCEHAPSATSDKAASLGLPCRRKLAPRRSTRRVALSLPPPFVDRLSGLAEVADLPLATFLATHLERDFDLVRKSAIKERVMRERGRMRSADIADLIGIEPADVLRIWSEAVRSGLAAPLPRGAHRNASRAKPPKIPRPDHAARNATIMRMRPASFSKIAAALGVSRHTVSGVVRRLSRAA